MDVCTWQGVGHGVGVSCHLLGGSDLRCCQPFGVCGEGLSPPVHISRVLGVAFKQPVIILHVSFKAISTCPVCLERPHEEQANSTVEKQSANAVVRTVAGCAPHLEFFNFRRRLFLVFTFVLVLRACCLKLNVLSSVTPR